MITQSLVGAARPYQGEIPVQETSNVPLWRIAAVVRWTGVVFLACSVLILTAAILPRMHPSPAIFEPPAAYLPRSVLPPLPGETDCQPSGYFNAACRALLFGKEVTVTYELGTRMIVRTAIKSREYRVGDLIAGWGVPSGITQSDGYTRLCWDTRFALLYTNTFQLESRVDYIVYELTAAEASTWHGFTNHKH
jgi:hypothetical protein